MTTDLSRFPLMWQPMRPPPSLHPFIALTFRRLLGLRSAARFVLARDENDADDEKRKLNKRENARGRIRERSNGGHDRKERFAVGSGGKKKAEEDHGRDEA